MDGGLTGYSPTSRLSVSAVYQSISACSRCRFRAGPTFVKEQKDEKNVVLCPLGDDFGNAG